MTAPFAATVVAEVREAARAYLRVVGREEDGVIDGLAAAALGLAEAFTGQALIVREHVAPMAAATDWRALPVQPVRSIAGGGAVSAVDIDASGIGWVRMRTTAEVRFVAGMAEGWATLPGALAQGVVLLTAHLVEMRGRDVPPPAAVGALWRPWRRMRIGSVRR